MAGGGVDVTTDMRLGRLRLSTPVGAGGMATIWRASHPGSDAPVAVKIQKPGVERTVQIDLDLAAWLAGQIHRHLEALRPFDLPAAIEEGVVAGGGTALVRARSAVDIAVAKLEGDEKIGGAIVARSLDAPARLIASNAGFEGAVIVASSQARGVAG